MKWYILEQDKREEPFVLFETDSYEKANRWFDMYVEMRKIDEPDCDVLYEDGLCGTRYAICNEDEWRADIVNYF